MDSIRGAGRLHLGHPCCSLQPCMRVLGPGGPAETRLLQV